MPDTNLFYIHDPMCSWCYAFNASLMALQKDLPTNIRIIYLLGGLAADTTDPMPTSLQNTIQQNWRRIEKTIPSILFNYDFWLLNTPFRSTFPACRAILAARKQGIRFEPKILHAIQTSYYQNARNPSLQATLKECATEAGLDAVVFLKDLTSSTIDRELREEIKLAQSMDVFSFPSLRLLHKEKLFPISIDYLNHQPMLVEILTINNI